MATNAWPPVAAFYVLIMMSIGSYALLNRRATRCASKRRLLSASPNLRRLYAGLYTIILIFGGLSFAKVMRPPFDLYDNAVLEYAGLAAAYLFFLLFVWAARALGDNYSPNYESRQPSAIVAAPPYSIVRHPMYIANCGSIMCLALASGSSVLFGAAAILAVTYFRSAQLENEALYEKNLAGPEI